MKKIILILFLTTLMAFSFQGTRITGKYLLVLIKADVTKIERQAALDQLTYLYGDRHTNADGTVTTNEFIKMVQFSEEEDVSKHMKVSNTVDHVVWNDYLWYSCQVSEKLSEEALDQLEQQIPWFRFYPCDDWEQCYKDNNLVRLINTNMAR